jgi:plasmid stabilization system protein ParE
MNLPIAFRRAARLEFDQAHDWYEKQKVGLGQEFVEAVDKVLERIAAMPEIHQIVYKDIRRALVQRFPYSIFYRVKSDRIVVLAVFHGKRNPAIWQARA